VVSPFIIPMCKKSLRFVVGLNGSRIVTCIYFLLRAVIGRGKERANNGKMRIVSQHDKDKKVVDIIG
jgi:hypothetical protein